MTPTIVMKPYQLPEIKKWRQDVNYSAGMETRRQLTNKLEMSKDEVCETRSQVIINRFSRKIFS